MKAPRARSLTFEDLPDDVIASVIELAESEAWPALALVNRRLHDLTYSPAVPKAWRSFSAVPWRAVKDPRLTTSEEVEERLASWRPYLLRRLQRVGGAVQTLVVKACPRMRLFQQGVLCPQDLLAPLCPGALHDLEWQDDEKPLPQSVLEVLPRLAAGLTRLKLGACTTTAELPAALQLCSRLEVLSVHAPLPPDLRPLTALWRLQQLHLLAPVGGPSAGPLPLPELPDRSELAPCLESLRVMDDFSGRGFLVGGTRVRSVHVYGSSGAQFIELSGLDDGTQPLGAVLSALLRPGGHIGSLALRDCQVAATQLACGRHLVALSCLRLVSCFDNGGVEAALEALLQQAPALRKLEVDDCPLLDGGDWLPPRLVGYSGLQSLTLSQCELEELPPGPYLRGLTSLDLSLNPIENWSLARALIETRELVELRAGDAASLFNQLPPDAVDWLPAVLACYPRLLRVEFDSTENMEDTTLIEGLWTALEARHAAAGEMAGPPAAEAH